MEEPGAKKRGRPRPRRPSRAFILERNLAEENGDLGHDAVVVEQGHAGCVVGVLVHASTDDILLLWCHARAASQDCPGAITLKTHRPGPQK